MAHRNWGKFLFRLWAIFFVPWLAIGCWMVGNSAISLYENFQVKPKNIIAISDLLKMNSVEVDSQQDGEISHSTSLEKQQTQTSAKSQQNVRTPKTKLEIFRSKYPEYNDLSDEEIALGLHQKFYKDLDKGQFYQKIGIPQDLALLYAQGQWEKDRRKVIDDLRKNVAFGILPPLIVLIFGCAFRWALKGIK
jgi:hypothetical protein